jgi:Ni2+-binding GTPase involved in maturation of urease and hydrogenase
MCETCGCGDPNLVSVEVHDKILSVNDRTAAHNREHFVESGVFAVNLMGSPGAGKTAVLEATARALAGYLRRGVDCRALDEQEVVAATGLDRSALDAV